jgi:hypothetical protein
MYGVDRIHYNWRKRACDNFTPTPILRADVIGNAGATG